MDKLFFVIPYVQIIILIAQVFLLIMNYLIYKKVSNMEVNEQETHDAFALVFQEMRDEDLRRKDDPNERLKDIQRAYYDPFHIFDEDSSREESDSGSEEDEDIDEDIEEPEDDEYEDVIDGIRLEKEADEDDESESDEGGNAEGAAGKLKDPSEVSDEVAERITDEDIEALSQVAKDGVERVEKMFGNDESRDEGNASEKNDADKDLDIDPELLKALDEADTLKRK